MPPAQCHGRRHGLPTPPHPAGEPLHIDIDTDSDIDTDIDIDIDIGATLVIDHSNNQAQPAPTWKKSFGHHRLLAFLDRPEIGDLRKLVDQAPRPTSGKCSLDTAQRCLIQVDRLRYRCMDPVVYRQCARGPASESSPPSPNSAFSITSGNAG